MQYIVLVYTENNNIYKVKYIAYMIYIYIIYIYIYTCIYNYILERDMAQWFERGALPMSLPAVWFRIPLGAEFSEKCHVSPLSILGHC